MIDRLIARLGERTFGFIGIAGVALAGVLVAAISFVPFGQRHYVAELANTAGLRTGEEVQIAGIGVGEVRKISLDGQHVRVDFTLDKDAHLGRSTTATVKIGTLLGNHFLEVAHVEHQVAELVDLHGGSPFAPGGAAVRRGPGRRRPGPRDVLVARGGRWELRPSRAPRRG